VLFLNITYYTGLQLSFDSLHSVLLCSLIIANIATKFSAAIMHNMADILVEICVIFKEMKTETRIAHAFLHCCTFTDNLIATSWGSSVSTETRLRAGRPSFNSRQRQWWDFSSLRHRVQTGSGYHPAS